MRSLSHRRRNHRGHTEPYLAEDEAKFVPRDTEFQAIIWTSETPVCAIAGSADERNCAGGLQTFGQVAFKALHR